MSDPKRRTPKARMVKDQPHDLRDFSNLLLQQMRARGLTPTEIAQKTWLREETIRSYIRAQSRPNRESLSLLRLVLGEEIVAPFAADADLVPKVERNWWKIHLSEQRVVLRVLAPMTEAAAAAVIKVLNDNGVHEMRDYELLSSDSPSVR